MSQQVNALHYQKLQTQLNFSVKQKKKTRKAWNSRKNSLTTNPYAPVAHFPELSKIW